MFSSKTVAPLARSSAAIRMAWASVGKPGYGAVRMGGMARRGPSARRRRLSARRSTAQPAWVMASVTVASSSGRISRRVTSPPAEAAAQKRAAEETAAEQTTGEKPEE